MLYIHPVVVTGLFLLSRPKRRSHLAEGGREERGRSTDTRREQYEGLALGIQEVAPQLLWGEMFCLEIPTGTKGSLSPHR